MASNLIERLENATAAIQTHVLSAQIELSRLAGDAPTVGNEVGGVVHKAEDVVAATEALVERFASTLSVLKTL